MRLSELIACLIEVQKTLDHDPHIMMDSNFIGVKGMAAYTRRAKPITTKRPLTIHVTLLKLEESGRQILVGSDTGPIKKQEAMLTISTFRREMTGEERELYKTELEDIKDSEVKKTREEELDVYEEEYEEDD